MNHQQVFRLWLSVGCIAVVCLSVFSNGQAQDVVSPNNPGQVVVQKNQFEFRTKDPAAANGTHENGLPTDPSASSPTARTSGLFNRRRGANNAFAAAGQPIGKQPVNQPKTNAANLQKTLETLKQAKDEEARKKSLETLSSVVSQLFDEDLKRRESEVGDIRNRAAKLKTLIDKRKESKDRIVDLQLKIQLNEVEGLGFTVKPNGRKQFESLYLGDMAGLGMGSAMGIDPGVRYPQVLGIPGGDMYAGGDAAGAADDPRRQSETAFHAATAKLKVANSEEERQAASQLLRSALEDYFAADLGVREREVKGIHERVESLDKLIERRRQARDQVISLQLEVLKNEADGLGFFSTSSGFNRGVRISVPAGAGGMFGFGR